jgi:lipopolysaccharide/colanic/teichoic acid biosynthesis glycosyltransferase
MKRVFDFIFSLAALILLLPVFIIVSIMVASDSKGGVFYLQERVGKDGKLFKLFKFRTMYVNSDRTTLITIGNRDPRITPVGFFLRKYKIDEFPQLINVIKGEMSLVGPRPEVKKFVDLYTRTQLQVLSVRPGISDFASIKFRNENALLEGRENPVEFYIKEIMPAKLELNLQYVQRRTFWMDLKVIALTIFSIFKANRE